MLRLLFTLALFCACIFLSTAQPPDVQQPVIAISARRAHKTLLTTGTPTFSTVAARRFASPATLPTIHAATTLTNTNNISATGDLISPIDNSDQCLALDDIAVTAQPSVVLTTCRGTADQRWIQEGNVGQWQTALDPTYCLATRGTNAGAGGSLTVHPCTDSRALSLLPTPTLTDSYQISGTTFVLDSGVYGYVALAWQNGWSYQHWRWLGDDLAAVNAEGCDIAYPLAATETDLYQQEMACDRVAKLQPPYVVPRPELAQRTLFPGPVPTDTPTVTQTFPFALNFKEHDYLRQSATPANWQSTGLYAPPGQVLRVTVTDATAAELKTVYLRIGVHTDQLKPDSGNVQGGSFLRYPNVVVRVKLQPGENLVRSPYGGPIILDGGSGAGIDKTITVAIAGAVQAPYFHAGVTTEAEWLARRSAPVPYAEIESDIAVIHVPSAEVRDLRYAEVLAVAKYYAAVGRLHNELSGLSADDEPLHQPPMGKYRHVEDIHISAGWGHSGFPAMYFNAWQIGVPAVSIERSSGWGVWHELGHNYQMGLWSYVYGTETTVNLWSLYAQERLFGNSRLVDNGEYAKAIAVLHDPAVTDKWNGVGVFGQLAILDQIRLAFPTLNWNLWTELIRRYRAMDSTEIDGFRATDQGKRDKFLTVLCAITDTNLTPHFEAWTIPITQEAKDDCAGFAPLAVESWLIDGAQPLYYSGNGTGRLTREWWTDVNGTALTDLKNSAAYPALPTAHTVLTGTLEGPRDWGNNYGEKLRGYLHPPVSGDYEFWLAGDDATQFWLSNDEDPLHATLLLSVTNATGYRGFDQYVNAIQRSAKVPLSAGERYYFAVLHKEGSGGDHVAVAWTIPAAGAVPLEPRKVIDGRYLSPFAGDLALRHTLAAGQPTTIQPNDDIHLTTEIFNQGTATAGVINLVATMPAGFTRSPANPNGWESGYRYARFVAESEAGSRGDWASMAEIGLLDAQGEPITNTTWSILYTDSENGDAPAANAIDGDPNTIWHTKWWGGTDPYPHELQIDLGRRQMPTGFAYLPRQSGTNGRVGDYRFYLSVDGVDWVEVAHGRFADDRTEKRVPFVAPEPRQLFRTITTTLVPGASVQVDLTLRATATIAPGNYTNSAEIVAAWDGRGSPLYDIDATGDTDGGNDLWIDDAIDNRGGDEDDQDIVTFQVGPLTTPTATITSTATAPTPTIPANTATPTPSTTTPALTFTATPTATAPLATATASATPSPPVTATSTVMSTVQPSPTSTATITPTPVTIPTATATPTLVPTALSTLAATPTLSEPTAADSDFDTIPDQIECDGKGICPDQDGDGLPNHRDIDSDGDGIVDAIEAKAVAAAAPFASTPVDTDHDGAADYLDTDSDDDTIPDATEGHDGDGDGKPDVTPVGLDSDGDGLDDAYDTLPATTLSAKNALGSNAALPDHNNDGIPDYLEKIDRLQQLYLPIVTR